MLNELMLAALGLKRCGQEGGSFHPFVKSPGRAVGLIVGLDQNGCPATLEFCDKDRMAGLWTIGRSGNHGLFPVLNKFPKPIWDVPGTDTFRTQLDDRNLKRNVHRRAECLHDACKKRQAAWGKEEENWWRRLRNEVEQLLPIVRCHDRETAALVALIERFLKPDNTVAGFLERLSELVIQAALNDQVPDMDLVERALIGKWDRNKKQYKASVPLVLDVDDYARFTRRVASPQMRDPVIACFSEAGDASATLGTCALAGTTMPLEIDKFPNPKLPVIGQVYLHSMNENVPCQRRYGQAGPASMPVGKETATRLAKGLQFLTAEDRRGNTWMDVPSHRRDGRDLLIVYLEDRPDSAIQTALLFAEPGAEASVADGAYESAASDVCRALGAEPGITADSLVRLFVLTKVDRGRVQVGMSTFYSVGNVIRGSSDWQTGAGNCPPVVCIMPGKNGKKGRRAVPHCPAPARAMRLLQYQWINGGTDCRAAPGCRLHEVYEVFLGEPALATRQASHLLGLTLQRTNQLLIGVGGAMRSRDWNPFEEKARLDCLDTVSLISILLKKLGTRKETYMEEPAFNVGRLLALVDTLHGEYCVHVRSKGKRERLPQLLGNALVPVALENPARCLARLSERLPVYQGWANTAQGEGLGLAKWTLGQLSKVSCKLLNQQLPDRMDDQAKAQLILGYLAHSESETSEESDTPETNGQKETTHVE
jgi:hypothetical protein